jgi:hypothetical protein
MRELLYRDIVQCLTEIHANLDYELSPPCQNRYERQIDRLYKARDEVLAQLKEYRR